MERAFEVLNAKGAGEDRAFPVEFIYDDEDYRTAVRLTRLSTMPIRFAPTVGYCSADVGHYGGVEAGHCGAGGDGKGRAPLLDSFGRPVYRVSNMATGDQGGRE